MPNFDSEILQTAHLEEEVAIADARRAIHRFTSELSNPSFHLNVIIEQGRHVPNTSDAYNLALARDLNQIRQFVAGSYLDPNNLSYRSNVVTEVFDATSEDSFSVLVRISESIAFAVMQRQILSPFRGGKDVTTYTEIPLPGVFEGHAALQIATTNDHDGNTIAYSITSPESIQNSGTAIDISAYQNRLNIIRGVHK